MSIAPHRRHRVDRGQDSKAVRTSQLSDGLAFANFVRNSWKVADTIAAEECTRQRWEAALRKDKLRAKPWEVPLVMSEDLFW